MSDQINAWFDSFDNFMQAAAPDVVAETAVEHFRENFQKESFDEQPWAPLTPKYARRKTRSSTRILTKTAALQSSIRPDYVAPERVRISAGNGRVSYAKPHNEGFAGQVAVRSHVNRNFMGKGKAVNIKAHGKFMRIPKRQFMGIDRTIKPRINQRLTQAFDAHR